MSPLRVVSAALVALAACAGASPSAPASPAPAAPERLYRSKCAGCHRAYAPDSLTRARWAEVMPRMGEKAHLADAERASLLAWLQARAKDANAAATP